MSDTQQQQPQAGQPQQEGNYGPQGPEAIMFDGYSTLNTQSERPSIEDDQCSWLDGFMPVGKGTLRTMPDQGQQIFGAPSGLTIVFFGFGNIGDQPYCIAVTNDGGVWAINTLTLTVNLIAGPGTIAGHNVGLSQWGAQFLIITCQQEPSNGYFLWDGTTFYFPGDSVPGFTTVPTGIQGNSVEIYQSRVWVANGPNIVFSAPESITDFSTGNGGGAFQSNDSFLRRSYVRLVQTNGFLYLIADSSINYISGVTTSGSPPTTTFSNQNADPEIGTTWPYTVQVFSRNIVFLNNFGAHISYGGAVTKISDALDGIIIEPGISGFVQPSSAKAIVFNKRIWCFLLPTFDPFIDGTVLRLFCWDGKRWWTTLQGITLIMIASQEIDSFLTAYGTNGSIIVKLFTNPSTAFTKVVQSKLFARPGGIDYDKSADRLWTVVKYNQPTPTPVTVYVDNENQTTQNGIVLTPASIPPTGLVVNPPQPLAQNGTLIGVTIETAAADLSLLSVKISPQVQQYRG